MLDKNNVAIILLAYSDFEALEIALANFSKSFDDNAKLFILQNGRGTYDCERTYRVAKRYEALFPNKIKVVDWIKPQIPYFAIKELLNDVIMQQYDYICKVDDDVFPLRSDWLDKLINCYNNSINQYGNDLGYVTGLVNNNPWGFNETLDIFNLKEEYFEKIAKEHEVGEVKDEFEPYTIIPKNEIYTGWAGTVWKNPYISRWLHEKTSLCPDLFIKKTEQLTYKEVDNKKRYSINVMFFKKEFWETIDNGGTSDEYMCLNYCRSNNKKIIADLSNPFIHICFYTQREENKDLLPKFREIYEKWLNLPYPISICPLKEYENENRLRFLEDKLRSLEYGLSNLTNKQSNTSTRTFLKLLFSVHNSKDKQYKIATILGNDFKLFKRMKQGALK